MEMFSRLFLTFLLNTIWQITLISIVTLFCDWLLRNTTAHIRHLLWVTSLIISFSLPVITCLDFYRHNHLNEQPIQSGIVQVLPNTESIAVLSTSPEISNVISVDKNLSVFLLMLFLLLLIYRSISFFKAWKQTEIIRQSTFSADQTETILSVIEECKSALEIKKIHILYSSIIVSPITIGALSPAVVLPENFLQKTDRTILLSAIGHELVHVKRNDFLFNLLYEIIYLPISFHPAATLMKRRISETRELSCDEYVTDKLLEPIVYARALVQLTASAMDSGRTTTMTIGILDTDVLEKRIMKVLNKSKITVNRRNLLLSSATLVFILALIVTISLTIVPVIAQQTQDQEDLAKKKAEMEDLLKIQQKNLLEKQQLIDANLAEKRKTEKKISFLGQNDLSKIMKVSMTDAIEIASKQQPGTVVESKLVFVKVGDSDEPFYAIRIVFDNGKENGEKPFLVSAVDGRIGVLGQN